LRGEFEARDEGVTFGDYLAVLGRYRSFIVAVAVVVTLPVAVVSARQPTNYTASAEVIQVGQSASTGLNSTEIERRAQTDVSLARVPAVAADVLSTTGAVGSTDDFLDRSSVKAATNSNVLVFTVEHERPTVAVVLANAYARAFAKYRNELGQASFTRAKEALDDSIAETEDALAKARERANGEPSATVTVLSQQYASLLDQQQRLLSTQQVDSSNLVVVPANRAVSTGSQWARNTLLALAFGVLLGVALAFVREALDSRIRTAEDLSELLALPLLGRVPGKQSAGAATNRLVMIDQPQSPNAESFRILRTNVDFANRPFSARTIMITSALQDDGRTAILANLGTAFARSGRDVTLVDLDLRGGSLSRLLDLPESPGITDVTAMRAELREALVEIRFTGPDADNDEAWGGTGTLEILPAGTPPPDPGDFVGMQPLADVLKQLAELSDVVLVDSPPLLDFGDTVALSANVDAIIVVLGLGAIRKPAADELRRILDFSPTPKLGYVLTGENAKPSAVSRARRRRAVADQRPPREAGDTAVREVR
jgi:Mrp family chromosome partitioning ATPase